MAADYTAEGLLSQWELAGDVEAAEQDAAGAEAQRGTVGCAVAAISATCNGRMAATDITTSHNKHWPMGSQEHPLPHSLRTLHLQSSPELELKPDTLPPQLTSRLPFTEEVFQCVPQLEELYLSNLSRGHQLAGRALPRSLSILRLGTRYLMRDWADAPPQLRRLIVPYSSEARIMSSYKELGQQQRFTVELEAV